MSQDRIKGGGGGGTHTLHKEGTNFTCVHLTATCFSFTITPNRILCSIEEKNVSRFLT